MGELELVLASREGDGGGVWLGGDVVNCSRHRAGLRG